MRAVELHTRRRWDDRNGRTEQLDTSRNESYFRASRLARLEGVEPPARGFEGRCSIQLSYRRVRRILPCASRGNGLAAGVVCLDGPGGLIYEPALLGASRPRRNRVREERWRGGREAEGAGLLNQYTAQSCIEGSNPSLSASQFEGP